MNVHNNVILSHSGNFFKFLEYEYHFETDGSLYIFTKIYNNSKVDKLKISYHCSGQINYKGYINANFYTDPIYDIKETVSIFSNTINLNNYPKYTGLISNTDFVIEYNNNYSKMVQFEIKLKSSINDMEEYFECFHFINFNNLFNLSFAFNQLFYGEIIKDFKILEKSKFEIPIQKDQALINYHQKINMKKDVILYSPNNQGTWIIIHANIMRVPPLLEIVFEDSNLKAKKIETLSSVALTRFEVFDQYGNRFKKATGIKEIILDSEIY